MGYKNKGTTTILDFLMPSFLGQLRQAGSRVTDSTVNKEINQTSTGW